MQVKGNKTPGRYRWRVQLIKPTLIRDPDTNEEKLEDVVVYSNYPAMKREQPTGQSETLSANAIFGKTRVTWELRFIPNLGIKTDWKIRDMFDKTVYNVIAPSTELDFRQGYLVLTEVAQ